MKRQEWKKWMAGLLAAGMLFGQPAAALADAASDAEASTSSSSTVEEPGEEDPEDQENGENTGQSDGEDPEPEQEEKEPRVETPVPAESADKDEKQTKDPSAGKKDPAEEAASPEKEPKEGKGAIEIVEETEEETVTEEEEEDPEEKEETSTNEQLVAGQQIVHAPVIIDNFRFWTVTRRYAFAKEDGTAILEDMDEDADVVGVLPEHGLCYVLKGNAEDGPGFEDAADPEAADAGAGDASDTAAGDTSDTAAEAPSDVSAGDTADTGVTWLYVESNGVRGFIKDEALYSGRRAQVILESYIEQREDPVSGELEAVLSDDVPYAESRMEPVDNDAFDWMKATAEQTVIQKDYALSNDRVSIREEPDQDARAIGVLPDGALCYIVSDRDSDWVYVESGDVRGFVKNEYLEKDETAYLQEQLEERSAAVKASELVSAERAASVQEASREDPEDELIVEVETADGEVIRDDAPASDVALNEKAAADAMKGAKDSTESAGSAEDSAESADSAEDGTQSADGAEEGEAEDSLAGIDQEKYPVYCQVTEKGEDQFKTAEQKVEPGDNKALYYTTTSPMPGTPGGKVRDSLVSYAAEFVGNPYVWGGTSLTGGADCSGFVQSIYAQYGYSLPRTSGEQSQYGTKIPVEEAEPGDLIFYAQNGAVYHVVIYAGNNETIEAMNESRGITYGHVLSSDAVWATRVLKDTYDEVVDFSSDIGEQNATKEMYGEELGVFRITYYCPCEICNGGFAGRSATGAPLVQGRTIAVDPNIIPYGTKVIIGGHVFTAEDCGGAIKGKRIDIFVNEHAMCDVLGTTNAHVYLTN